MNIFCFILIFFSISDLFDLKKALAMDLTMDDLLPLLEEEPALEPIAAPAKPFSVEESPEEAGVMKDGWILPDPEVLEDPVLVPEDPRAPANPFRVEDRPDLP